MSSLDDHRAALEHNEARHSLILSIMTRSGFGFWPLGQPGRCAVQNYRSMVLADLDQQQCHRLADDTHKAHILNGIIGPDDTTDWYTSRAQELGTDFALVEEQLIWSLRSQPRYPGCPGHSRLVTIDDLDLIRQWLPAFQTESNPHDPAPRVDDIESRVRDGDITLWIDQERVVSMAGVTRRLKHSAAITGVYTPPELRGNGYAGAATAACIERVYQEGRKMVSLYTDAGNAASNRCYEKIGFTQECRSAYWVRR